MRRITIFFTGVLLLSLAASAVLVHRVDQLRVGSSLEDVLYLPSAPVLKRLSLGYNTLLADIYWTRAVQYFGSKHHAGSARYNLLGPLLNITTDLDPHLLVAYQFGGIFLAQQPPEGAGSPQQAVALVEKGIRANPDDWQLYYNLGWIYVSELKNYQAAFQVFQRGAQVPGANPALKVLAASMAQRGGEPATARLLWVEIYKTTDNKALRANAIKRLRAIQVDEDITKLEKWVAAFKRTTGRYPANWEELRALGWRGQAVDPLGNPYRLTADGRIEVTDYDQLPFITKGLPLGKVASKLSTAAQAPQAAAAGSASGGAVNAGAPQATDKPPTATLESKP